MKEFLGRRGDDDSFVGGFSPKGRGLWAQHVF